LGNGENRKRFVPFYPEANVEATTTTVAILAIFGDFDAKSNNGGDGLWHGSQWLREYLGYIVQGLQG
jgi:hypothetical protein